MKFISITLIFLLIISNSSCLMNEVKNSEKESDESYFISSDNQTSLIISIETQENAKELTKWELEMGLEKYKPTTSYKVQPGLYLKNGKVMHEGEEFRQIGVNFHSAFSFYFLNGRHEMDKIFKQMNEYDISYARINFGLFWPINYKEWENNKEVYFDRLDEVVRTAEKYNIGLICSLFWYPLGISDYFDESGNAWGNPQSKTRKYMEEYTETVVSRYNESPAIWMWEFGNEMNLYVDLPNAAELRNNSIHPTLGTRTKRDESDDFNTDMLTPLLEEFALIVNKHDTYNRIISSGNSEPRPSQYNQYINNSWQKDTLSEMTKTLLLHNPDPINSVSIHTYDKQDFLFMGNNYTYSELFKVFKRQAESLNKVLFVGEFFGWDERAEDVVDAIVENKVPISAVWAIGRVEYSLSENPKRCKEVLEYISKANNILKNQN